MNVEANVDRFADWIADILRAHIDTQADQYQLQLRFGNGEPVELNRQQIAEALAKLESMEAIGDTALASSRSYEMLVREEGHFYSIRTRSRGDLIDVQAPDNGLRYILGHPTDEYILLLIYMASQRGAPRALARPVPGPARMIIDRLRDEGDWSAFDLLRRYLPAFLTLRVISEKDRSYLEFERYSSAFLFNISYNMDAALVPQRHLEELLRTARIARIRRSGFGEIDPPRRHYVPDLLYHYQLAVGADNPLLEYISYYHIAEHFFEEVFNEDLIDSIKERITRPDFSYKRKNDISGLIKYISQALQIRNDRITFSELEALRLTLRKYVSIDQIVEELKAYDNTLLTYYHDSTVTFSGGDIVNLVDQDTEQVYKKLAARLYKTRNAIVHSKESEKSKYTPFRDDRILIKEIPLIRFVAEQVILSTSTLAT